MSQVEQYYIEGKFSNIIRKIFRIVEQGARRKRIMIIYRKYTIVVKIKCILIIKLYPNTGFGYNLSFRAA